MAVARTDVIERYHKLRVEKALELGCVDFIVKGGLICEEVVQALDVDENVQFRFIPPSVRIAVEHWEFAGQLYLHEKELGVARGAFPWLEQVSDYLCLATAGTPVKMEPFREMLTESHALPASHPREVWYDEVKIGRIVTQDMLIRANTFMWIAQSKIRSDLLNSYRRSLWWLRHGANVEMESPALAYTCFFNSLEILLRYDENNKRRGKPTRNRATKAQFLAIFDKEVGNELYQLCYGAKDQSLYDLRNDIDHGTIVGLGSGMLRVLRNLNLIKALVVDLALYWIKQNAAAGGWLAKGVLNSDSMGLIMLSVDEAKKAFGTQTSGPVTRLLQRPVRAKNVNNSRYSRPSLGSKAHYSHPSHFGWPG
jgi:hypothetical protein